MSKHRKKVQATLDMWHPFHNAVFMTEALLDIASLLGVEQETAQVFVTDKVYQKYGLDASFLLEFAPAQHNEDFMACGGTIPRRCKGGDSIPFAMDDDDSAEPLMPLHRMMKGRRPV